MKGVSLFYYRRGQYFVSPFLIGLSIILFIVSSNHDNYLSVPFHSGAILVSIITIILSLLLYFLVLNTVFKEYVETKVNLYDFNLKRLYIEKITFILSFVFLTCLPSVIGGINLYEKNKNKKFTYSKFQILPKNTVRVRGGLLNCYNLTNNESKLVICSKKKSLKNIQKAEIGIYKGLISTFYRFNKPQ